MNTGIGDAVNLAWKLAAVLRRDAADHLLDTYEPERIAFARRLVATTDRVFTIVTQRGVVARWMRTKDNFTPLTSLRWQAHVYGEPRHGIADVCQKLTLPLHVFPWQPAMKRTGLKNGSLHLIRPDGYVALADSESDPERLHRYCDERGIRYSC